MDASSSLVSRFESKAPMYSVLLFTQTASRCQFFTSLPLHHDSAQLLCMKFLYQKMKFMKNTKFTFAAEKQNQTAKERCDTRQICYNEPIFEVTPHNESCGALRKFCALTSFRFHGNTASITAKLRIVSTQNLLANHTCLIMRYYLVRFTVYR
ncbi:MAG: hypothetical protein ACLSDM_04800 [Butyricicoccus sp.]